MDDAAEDIRLARRVAQEGDASAEAALCTRLYPRIRAYGRRHLRDATAAADLAQTVLVSVLEALRERRIDDLDRFPAFVMSTSRNLAAGWRRGEQRRRSLLETFGPSLAEAAEDAPEPIDRARLEDCLEHLDVRARSVLTLTFYAERTADAIAAELGMTAGNVRVVRHRALGHLQECLGGAS